MRKAVIILLILWWPAVSMSAFDKQYIGINYSPYHGGSYGSDYPVHPKDWGSYTQQDIENDLKVIMPKFNYLRTYTVQFNQKYIVPSAAKYNIKVALGAYLWQPLNDPEYNKTHNYDQAKAWVESNHTYPELNEAISEANAHPETVKCIVVGNEWIGKAADGYLTPPDGINYMSYVRGKLTGAAKNILVTTSERWGVLAATDQATKALVAAADQFVFANIYPFWDGAKIENWKGQFLADYNALKTAIGGKEIVVGETGWPTGVEPVAAQHTDLPSIPNQKRYILEYTQWAIANQVTSFLFEMFDEPWKWQEGQNTSLKDGVGDHWGLYYTAGRTKWLGSLSLPGNNGLLLGQD